MSFFSNRAIKPNMGPMERNTNKYALFMISESIPNNWILRIVNEKPIQFVMVNKVPLLSDGAFCATKVENKGESAITTIPQKSRNKNKAVSLE